MLIEKIDDFGVWTRFGTKEDFNLTKTGAGTPFGCSLKAK
jgi:hypothetical protein